MRRVRGVLRLAVLVLIVGLFANVDTSLAEGTHDDPGLDSKATHILIGRVESIQSFWDNDSSLIYSSVGIEVESYLKGASKGNEIFVTCPGGVIGDLGFLTSAAPQFAKNERVKVFLKLDASGEFTIVGGRRGKNSLSGNLQAASSGYSYSGLHWDSTSLPVRYYINEAVSDSFRVAVQQSFQTWEDDLYSYMDYTYVGTTTVTGSRYDGFNVVSWEYVDGPGSILAQCGYWYYPYSGHIVEFDIVFDTSETWSSYGEPGKFDIQNVGTHEAGHTLSLDDLYGQADSEQTMYGYAAPGETKKRTLGTGDVAGIRFIYPSAVSDYDAVLVENTIPSSMAAGQSYSISVTFRNTGTKTWIASESVKLGSPGDSDPFAFPRQLLSPSDSVAPGQVKSFLFMMTAPPTAGYYMTDWRMLREGLLWFGGTLTKTITVTSTPSYGATIVSNDIPVSMMSGQSYTVHVTVRNTGSNVWTASAGYKLGSPGDSDSFAFPRVSLDTSDSIGYGQEKTFTFTMTAPALPGTYITDWMMLREGVTWFGQTLTVRVTVSGLIDSASIAGNNIPTTMTAGQSYSVQITVRNTGTTTWTAAAGYKLGGVGDSDPFAFPRILLDPSDSIVPGQSKIFTFTMTAPHSAGSYTTDWRMVREGVAWFGQTLTVTVKVASPVDNAIVVSDTIPSAMTAGQSYAVEVTLRNTGTSTWTQASNYKLGSPGDSDPFGSARQELALSESIVPGQEKTFTFMMTAPSTSGTYVTDWRMLRELVAWFGGTLSKTVTVSSILAYDAVIVSEDIPSTMVAGQSYVVHIRVRNLGSNTWTASSGYKLGSPGDSDPFAFPRQELDPSEIIESGQEKVFTFTMVAPTTPGSYSTDWRMLREGVTWFGATLTKTIMVTQ